MKSRFLVLLLVSFVMFFDVSAQKAGKKITITGKVVDISNNPVAGAVLMIDGQNTDWKTNTKGIYKIKVKPSALQIGVFTTITGVKEEPITGRSVINFNLDKFITQSQSGQGYDSQEETVDGGYSATKKKNMTKPVTQTDVTGKQYASFSSIYDMLRTVPGVMVSGSSVTIRGMGTTGSTSPMFVVNGTPVRSISGIDPSMVKSIEILKGPAASIYGLEGANGVVLIKLKGID